MNIPKLYAGELHKLTIGLIVCSLCNFKGCGIYTFQSSFFLYNSTVVICLFYLFLINSRGVFFSFREWVI
jgi:hypothetical protein